MSKESTDLPAWVLSRAGLQREVSPNTATSYSSTHGVVRVSAHVKESQPRVCIADSLECSLHLHCGNINISLPFSLWKLSQDLQASELSLIPKAWIQIVLPLVTHPWVVPSCRVVWNACPQGNRLTLNTQPHEATAIPGLLFTNGVKLLGEPGCWASCCLILDRWRSFWIPVKWLEGNWKTSCSSGRLPLGPFLPTKTTEIPTHS